MKMNPEIDPTTLTHLKKKSECLSKGDKQDTTDSKRRKWEHLVKLEEKPNYSTF